jgi:autotransporter-associated beta strand protein
VNPRTRISIYLWLAPWLVILGFCAPAALGSYQTITNDTFYLTTAGASTPIYAQGGGISKFGNTYYWYGIQYAGAATYYKTPTAANATANTTFVAINCYSSTDLAHWTFQNKIISTSTPNFTKGLSWIGRMGSVVYNSTSNQYVMWFQYSGPAGSGQACCTGTSPTGNFVLNNVQTAITNVYDSVTGDCTIFCDVDHGSTPYLVFSDSHGREHLYVSPLSSTFLAIQPATLISEWPQGQEANNMFVRNGIYYACMSNLAGWSYSSAYQVNSPNILTPSSYTADATFAGTDLSDTYYSQISFIVPVAGNKTTSYILVGDRWSDNDSSYLSAGHGLGYNIMGPLTFNGSTPTFLPVASFQIDTVTGNWRATPAFAAPTGLTATPSDGQVALSWDASGGAASYTVERATSAGGPYAPVATGVTSTTSTDTLLTDGTTYYYEVAAVMGSATSSLTLPVSAIPLVNPAPAAPGELSAAATTAQVALSWDASPGATSYVVQRAIGSAGAYATIATGTSTTYTDTNVTYGPTYYYEIEATTSSATSTNSPPVNVSLTGNITWSGATSGNWDTTSTNWLFAATPALYEDGDTVNFTDAATSTAITIGNAVTPAAMTFSNSTASYTVGGASISGTGGVTESGKGMLTLSGANTYLGPTTLASGATLVVANANALQNSTLNFTNGTVSFAATTTAATFGGLQGTNTAQNLVLANTAGPVALTVGGNNSTTTYSGNLSGAGSVTKSGTGAVTLSNANYTGATTVNSGTLTIAGAIGSSSAPAGAINVTNGALNVNGAAVYSASLENQNTSTVTLTGNGIISLRGALSVNGNNSDDDGVVSLLVGSLAANSVMIGRDGDDLGATAPAAGSTTDGLYVDGATVSIATTLGVGSTANVSSAQMRVDAGSVTVGGIATVTNNAGSRYSLLDLNGGTFTDGDPAGVGILVGGNSNANLDAELLIRGTAVVNTPAITLGNGNDTGGILNFTDIGGTIYIGSGGIVSTAPSPTVVAVALGSASVTQAPVIGASATWSSSLPMTLTDSSGVVEVTFRTANASGAPENITLSGGLSGTGGLTESGGGTLILSGDNTYAGVTSVLGGTLEVTGSLSSTSSLAISKGATFYLAGGSLAVAGNITNNGIFKVSGTPALAQTGSFINNGVLDLINGPETLPGAFTNNGTVIDSASVKVQQMAMNGSNFTMTIQSYAQHTYQLQRATSMASPITWTNVGAVQAGTGSPLTFTDTGAPGGQGFYQVQVSP